MSKIPNPYFENVPLIGNLHMYYMIFEDDYPVLFICSDEEYEYNLYICLCCDVRYEQRWLIAPISRSKVVSLITDRITLSDVFEKAEGNCYIARWTHDNGMSYEVITADKFPKEDLPIKGEYLEAHEDDVYNIGELVKDVN